MSVEQAQISVLEFPDNVRKRKEMYLPNKDHSIFEIVDNAIDEHLAGYATMIAVAIVEDTIVVEDNGRGIPITKHPKYPKLSQAEVAYTVLHAGGKFGGGGYKISGGLHGVGASVVNALSEQLSLAIKTGGKKYQIDFSKGHIINHVHVVEEGLEDTDTGTEVQFKLDPEIWKDETLDLKRIRRRIQQLAYLNPGLTLYLYIDTDDKDGKRVKEEATYYYPDGLTSYVEKLTKNKTLLTNIVGTKENVDGNEISIAMAYTNAYSEETYSFCNNISTEDGGDHLTGFKMGLTKAINDYAVTNKFIKEENKFESDDTREGIVAIIAIKVEEPAFEGQAKSKLKMTEIRTIVRKMTEEFITSYLDKNPDEAKIILDKIGMAANARKAAQRARETARKQKDIMGGSFVGKLADCQTKDPKEAEIYIVEGDSAGGSAKSGRDRRTQAILPLRGKIINVEKARLDKVLANNEIKSMITAFGTGIAEDFDISKLRYHKIIIMTDADVDGAHISTLLITFFYRYLRPIIEAGHVYLAMPPLYKLWKGKNVRYAYSDAERDKIIAELGDRVELQRYKGLGEMDAHQLWETTMDPEVRTLIQVTMEDAEIAEQMITICMGDDVKPRRDFIIENALEADIDV